MKDREYHRQYSMDYYYRKKAELIQLLGGKCCECGSEEALEFDHLDPQTKLFAISSLLSHAWAKVLEEVKREISMYVKYVTFDPEKCEVGEPSRVRKWSPPMERFNNPPFTAKHSEARRLRARAKQKKAQR